MSRRRIEVDEYERRVLLYLRKHLVGDVSDSGELEMSFAVEDVSLEKSSTPDEDSIVILFRVPDRPGCLFGYRAPALNEVDPELGEDPEFGDEIEEPEIWAGIIRASLQESILSDGYGLPSRCEPEGVTWIWPPR